MKTSLIARRIENDKSYFFKKENIEPVVHTQVVIWIDVPTRVRKFCVADKKAASYRMKQQLQVRKGEKVLLVRRDDRPSCTTMAVAARSQCYQPRQLYFSKCLGLRNTLRVGSHLCGVYCERDKRDLSIFAEGAWK